MAPIDFESLVNLYTKITGHEDLESDDEFWWSFIARVTDGADFEVVSDGFRLVVERRGRSYRVEDIISEWGSCVKSRQAVNAVMIGLEILKKGTSVFTPEISDWVFGGHLRQ